MQALMVRRAEFFVGQSAGEGSSERSSPPAAPCWCLRGKEGGPGARGRVFWDQPPTLLLLPLQMELKAGKGAGERAGPDWKAALQREREEQQHLLAESYSAVMELTRQLQISERNWSQEKLQLVERLQGEKQQVEQQVKELQNRLSQVRPAAATAGIHCGRRPGLGSPSVIAGSRCSENLTGQSLRLAFLCALFISQLSSDTVTVSFVLISSRLPKAIESFPFPQG